jgi:hypothetical protein
MQFDTLRAFPYPVLRPDIDDYTDGELQATVDFILQKDSVIADVSFALSIKEIGDLVNAGKAHYVVVLACRDTYFRKAISSNKPKFTETFKAGELRGEVQISPYIVASADISSYKCPLINSEFGSGPFHYEKGSLLAIDRPQTVYIGRDLFKPISSVFSLVRNETLQGPEWRLDLSGDKVVISVSGEIKEQIDRAKHRAVLINSIYFAAVMQCLAVLKAEPEAYEGYRWSQVFMQKCHDLGLSLEHDEYILAQKLMKLPFGLITQYVFGEAAND